jgi:molybdopterin-guanine dinucleotide biosynthesis protein A
LAGPLAGILAAMRWAPAEAWVFVACDLPLIDHGVLEWLLAERRPGRWAVIPTAGEGLPEPLLAIYEPQARLVLELFATGGRLGPSALVGHPKVATVPVPPGLVGVFANVNTAADLSRVRRRRPR